MTTLGPVSVPDSGEDGLDRAEQLGRAIKVMARYGIASPAVSRRTGTGAERPPKGKSWSDVLAK